MEDIRDNSAAMINCFIQYSMLCEELVMLKGAAGTVLLRHSDEMGGSWATL
jgi:hypothetical protein